MLIKFIELSQHYSVLQVVDMGMLAVFFAFFVNQVIIVQSQIIVPFTSWSCNAQNTPESLSVGFLKTENTNLLTSNNTKLNCNLNNSNNRKNLKIAQGQTKERISNPPTGIQSKHSVDKGALSSPLKPTIGLLSTPNSETSENRLSIQNLNNKEKFTPQVLSLPLIELSKFDINNALSTKYSDINYHNPTAKVAPLNKSAPPPYTENLSTNKNLIPIKPYTVSEPTNRSTVNCNVNRGKDYISDCNVAVKPYVSVTAPDIKKIEAPKFYTSYPQWLLTDENKNKIHSDTLPQFALNINENPFTTGLNILPDTVLPNLQNVYAQKSINNSKLNDVPAPVRFTVNGDANYRPLYSYDGNPEKMCYESIPAIMTSPVKNLEIQNYKTITPQFSLQDGNISKQQGGTLPEIAINTKENHVPPILNIFVHSNVENLSVNKDINSVKLDCASSVTLPTPSVTINDDLNCVKAYILQSKPEIKTITTSEVKKVELPITQRYNSQLLLSDINKDKTPIVTSTEMAMNIKENLIKSLPNVLADATNKALKNASPLLNNKGVYVTSKLLNNNMQNMNSKIVNLSPIPEKTEENSTAKFSKPFENISKVIIPNIQMNVMPIINNNMAPVTQLNLKSYELRNEKSNGNSVRSLQIPHISNIHQQHQTLSFPGQLSEILKFGFHQSNEPYCISFNTVSIPQPTSTYIGPVSVPPDPSVYKTRSDKYTNCLRNSLNQLVSVLTSNILSAFKENCASHKTMDTLIKPVTLSYDISSITTQTPNSLNLPVFSLNPPLIESPKSLPRPKVNLPVANTSRVRISSNSEEINRLTASSQPYISSITINLSPSKDTTNKIIIMI